MSRHPTDGIKSSKPRIPGAGGNGKVSKAELSVLNREYLNSRNRSQAAKAEAAEIALAERKGELISKKWAFASLSYLLVCLRQEIMAVPGAWAPRLAGCTVEEVIARLREMTHSWLEAVADLRRRSRIRTGFGRWKRSKPRANANVGKHPSKSRASKREPKFGVKRRLRRCALCDSEASPPVRSIPPARARRRLFSKIRCPRPCMAGRVCKGPAARNHQSDRSRAIIALCCKYLQ